MKAGVRPPRLYGIADGDVLGLPAWLAAGSASRTDPVSGAVRAMAEAGVGWIQVRLKSCSDAVLYDIVERSVRALEGSGALLWVNDRADVAALFPGTAVHVGQDDLPPDAVRQVLGEQVLGEGPLVGLSCHDLEQILRADANPNVDVVAFGPIYATTSKQNPDPAVGLDGLLKARAATRKPLVAIGGIDLSNARRVLDAGADSVVVLGALCRGDVAENSRCLTAALEDP